MIDETPSGSDGGPTPPPSVKPGDHSPHFLRMEANVMRAMLAAAHGDEIVDGYCRDRSNCTCCQQWVDRYATRFATLYQQDTGFRSAVDQELIDAVVARLEADPTATP